MEDVTVEIRDVPYKKRNKLENVVPLERPYTLYIDICGACNLKCVFCPCNTVDYMNEERHKIMNFDFFKKIIDDLDEFKGSIKTVYLHSYGEPLLNKSIGKMIKYLRESNKCESIRLVTNGILLNKEMSENLVSAGLDRLTFSLIGLSSEEYLKTCGVDLNFSDICKNISDFYEVSREKTKLVVKATSSFVDSYEKKEKFFGLFDHISDYILIEDIMNLWPEFIKLDINKQNQTGYREWMNHIKICSLPLTAIAIHSNGLVSCCQTDWKFEIVCGDVNKQTVKEIWDSHVLKEYQIALLRNDKNMPGFCKDCTFRSLDNVDDVADEIIGKLVGKEKRGNYEIC